MRGQSRAWASFIFPLLRLHPTVLHNSGCEPKTRQLLQGKKWTTNESCCLSTCYFISRITKWDAGLRSAIVFHLSHTRGQKTLLKNLSPVSACQQAQLMGETWNSPAPELSRSSPWHRSSLGGLRDHCRSLQTELFCSTTICTHLELVAHVQSRNNVEQLKSTFKINRGDNLFLLQKNQRSENRVTIYAGFFFFNS